VRLVKDPALRKKVLDQAKKILACTLQKELSTGFGKQKTKTRNEIQSHSVVVYWRED